MRPGSEGARDGPGASARVPEAWDPSPDSEGALYGAGASAPASEAWASEPRPDSDGRTSDFGGELMI